VIVIHRWGIHLNPNRPFFPNPLGDFEPEKPDFEPEIDPDYEDNLEEDCLSCGKQFGIHSTKDIVQCTLNELRGENPKG